MSKAFKFHYNVGELRTLINDLLTPEIELVYVGIDDLMESTMALIHHNTLGYISMPTFNLAQTFINWRDDNSNALIRGHLGSYTHDTGCIRLMFKDGVYMDIPFKNQRFHVVIK